MLALNKSLHSELNASTRLFADLVTDSLTEYSYDADLADLTYQFASHNLGLYISLSGYNDKLHVLAKVVFEKARNLEITPERLHVVKNAVCRRMLCTVLVLTLSIGHP